MLLRLLKGSFGKMEFPEPAPATADAGRSAETGPPAYHALFPNAADQSVVIILYGQSRSNPFSSMTEWLKREFGSRGLHVHALDMMKPGQLDLALESLFVHNKVRCGITWGGVGSDISTDVDGVSRNVWEMHKIPLFRMMGDHPAYFLDAHVSPHPTFVNLYGYTEHRDYFLRHFKPAGYGATVPYMRIDPLTPGELDFEAKAGGKILFLKNGNDPETLRRDWRRKLAKSSADMLLAMSEELLAGLPAEREFRIERLVVAHFARIGVDISAKSTLLSFYVAQLDDYLRRVKSLMIAESLLDYPIEVHGECWEHLDFTGRRAKLIPFGDYQRSSQLIKEGLCVLDMSPNTFSLPHERFVRCASRHTLCVTNYSDYLAQTYGPLGQPLFDFTPDSIRAAAEAVIADPQRHVEIGRAVGEKFARLAPENAYPDLVDTMSEQIRMEQGPYHGIQSFVIWPPGMLQQKS